MELSAADSGKWATLIKHGAAARTGALEPISRTGEYGCQYKTKPHKRLSKDEVTEAIKAYEAGATTRELASRFGCHRNTVAQCLKNNGLTLRLRPMSDERIVKAIELYEAGLSLAKVGNAIGADAETVRQRLLGHGVKLRGPHDRRDMVR